MSIRSILVNLDVDHPSPGLLAAAIDLARRFDARLSGFAAAQPPAPEVPIAAGAVAASWYDTNRAEVEARLEGLEGEFMAVVPQSIRGKFISYVDPPTPSLIAAASSADLLLLSGSAGRSSNPARQVDVGELMLGAGRPVLLAAAGVARIETEKALIGWKDTREARRAVADALPFLQLSRQVVVATVSEGDRSVERASLEGVIAWLATHNVEATGEIFPATGPSGSLADIARLQNVTMLVTGGYGHSRLRERLFGGMTRSLLAEQSISRLFSN